MYLNERILDIVGQKILRRGLATPDTCIAFAKDILGTQGNHLICNERGFNFIAVVADERTVLRFPRNRVASRELEREAEFLKQFAPLSPVPVPHLALLHHAASGVSCGRYAYIAGAPFTQERYQACTPAARTVIARQLGKFLTALHTFPIQRARQAGVRDHDMLRWEQKDFQKVRRFLFPRVEKGAQAWAAHLFRDWIDYLHRTALPCAVVHADFREEHILIDKGVVSGVIDFGDLKISDPALDFSFLLEYGKDFAAEVLAHYALPHEEGFERRMQYYAHRHQLVVPAYLLERGRAKEEVAGMIAALPAYIQHHPLERGRV